MQQTLKPIENNRQINIVRITDYEMLNGLKDSIFFKRKEVDLRDRILFIAIDSNGTRMGDAQIIHDSGLYAGNVGIGYVEVFNAFRRQGISLKLLQAIFDYAAAHERGIRTGHFTTMGEKYLRPRFETLEAKYKIPVIYM